jgi:uncharacterized lipoprotein
MKKTIFAILAIAMLSSCGSTPEPKGIDLDVPTPNSTEYDTTNLPPRAEDSAVIDGVMTPLKK